MLFNRSRKILSETASADLLDPEVSEEVKDAVNDLEDVLTTNVEEVPASDKESNGMAEGLKENAVLFESSYAGAKYSMDIRDLMRICEAEEEETGVTPDAGDVAEDVAENNDVENKDDLVIVAPADVAEEIIESCLNEAKCGGKKGKAKKKAKGMAKALKEVKEKGFKVAVVGKE